MQKYTENNVDKLSNFNDYWKNEIKNPAPLFFFMVPYLKDNQIAKIIKSCYAYDLSDNHQINQLTETLIIHFFEKGYDKSILELVKLKEKYCCFELDLYKKNIFQEETEEKTLDEYLYQLTLNNPSLLYPYCRLTHDDLVNISKKWLRHKLEQNKINETTNKYSIIKFIDIVFEKMDKEQQESIIPYMLYETKNLDLLNAALKKYGCENIFSYKPIKCPFWIEAKYHRNIKNYKKFLRNGVDLFDFNKKTNETFMEIMIDGLMFNEYQASNSLKRPQNLEELFDS